MKNVLKNKLKCLIVLIFLILFYSLPSIQSYETSNLSDIDKEIFSDVYGFVIPLPKSQEISKNPNLQYTLLNLINDLLRIDVPVYWTSKEMNIFNNNIGLKNNHNYLSFEKGTFIIPFTGNLSVDNKIIVELKSVDKVLPIHQAQLLTYMKLAGIKIGLVMNFNVRFMKNGIKRMVL